LCGEAHISYPEHGCAALSDLKPDPCSGVAKANPRDCSRVPDVHVNGALFYFTLSLRVRTEDILIYEEPEKFNWLAKGIGLIAVNELGDGFLLDFNFEAMLGLVRSFLPMEA